MMPTDTERREVAARLRELVPCLFDDGEYIDCGEVEETLGLVNDDGAWYKADGVMRLADLIEPEPERTCQDVEGGNFFRCSKCGCELMRFADGWKPLYMGEVRYCPNCGARVVDE